MSPESQTALFGRDNDGMLTWAIDHEQRAGHRIFRPAAICGRTETGIAPRAGPVLVRIDLGVRKRLFIADKRAGGRVRTIQTRLPPDLPKHLVAAEKCQMHSMLAGCLD